MKTLHTVNNFVQLTSICNCKRSITIAVAFYSASSSCCGKCFLRFSTDGSARCLSTLRAFSVKVDERVEKGTKVGWDNKWLPWPCLLALWAAFPLWSNLLVSHSNSNLYPCHPPIPLCFPHLHPELQWSENEHTNYSLAVPKIANNYVCVRVCVCLWGGSAGGPVFASALPWQPGFARECLPFFFKRFFSVGSKKTVHTGAANCILFVVCYVIIKHPKIQVE